MVKQIAKYGQSENVYTFMDEKKNVVVINADVVEKCVNQKIKANEWIKRESDKYHETMEKYYKEKENDKSKLTGKVG
ncbi:hypothetical protein CW663_08060 [Macrococcoides caseolyticum]|uniref:hypothetical protein n=1 Tax=Macrococcoides caseolyticum TaxID=69966 RepID=UPI000C327DEF|nr:hypothetical protein [Macrococcus caseolyticus]PKE67402.1 hypothetical protein CW663_08060 [Macrococcus caseolyticus]